MLTKEEADEIFNALSGKSHISPYKVYDLRKKFENAEDGTLFYEMMWGRQQRSPLEVAEMLERNTQK